MCISQWEEYEGPKATDYRLHEPYKSIILQASTPAELLKVGNEVLKQLNGAESVGYLKN